VASLFLLGEVLAHLPNAAYALFERVTRVVPGVVVTVGIDAMLAVLKAIGVTSTSAAAKAAEKGTALVLFVVLGAVVGAALGVAGRRGGRGVVLFGGLAGVALFAVAASMVMAQTTGQTVISVLWLGGLCVAWGTLIGRACLPPTTDRQELLKGRRLWTVTVLGAGVSSLIALALARLGRWRGPGGAGRQTVRIDVASTSGPAASPPPSMLAARFPLVSGTRPEITDNDRFYRIDINLRAPEIDPQAWRLELAGLVARPRAFTLEGTCSAKRS
jgi:hypothetical protein